MRTSRSSHSSQRISKTSSQKRSIVTPHPASAALIQASFKASRPASARKLRAGTKNQFASELELFMAEQLEECKTEEEKHQIYRNTFTSIINRFENYRDSMIAIKDGYESIIDNLTDEINKSEVNNQSTMKSQNEFLILLDEEKQKMDQKSENYNKLAQQLHEQISLLTNEVSELKEKIQIHKTKLNDDEELARQHWHVIHDYTKRSKKKEIKAQKSRDNYSGLEERKLYLKNEIKNYHSIIAQTLDDILYKEREIKKTNKNIVELKEKKEIEFSLAQTKKDKIFELEQLKDNLTNSISNYKNEIVQMNKENSDISIYLNNILKVNSKQVAEFDDPVRLTERFVACLRPRRNAST